MSIGITGKNTSIAKAFTASLTNEKIIYGRVDDLPLDLDRYLLCAGVLIGKTALELEDAEATEMFRVNFLDTVKFCDRLFLENDHARVCVIGSYSGIAGSYDIAYAGSKAALHLYIETKKLRTKDQHLVGIAPTIIEDAGMTLRRADLQATLERGEQRRLGRWLTSAEVARAAQFALNESALCNTVIHMTGGNW